MEIFWGSVILKSNEINSALDSYIGSPTSSIIHSLKNRMQTDKKFSKRVDTLLKNINMS